MQWPSCLIANLWLYHTIKLNFHWRVTIEWQQWMGNGILQFTVFILIQLSCETSSAEYVGRSFQLLHTPPSWLLFLPPTWQLGLLSTDLSVSISTTMRLTASYTAFTMGDLTSNISASDPQAREEAQHLCFYIFFTIYMLLHINSGS